MADSADDLDSMLPYFDTWDRHNSIAFSSAKGLRNAPGENNCFVNCAVQVFWHLDVFRRSYRRLLGHTCMGNSCIFCALKVIFTQFQYSDKTSLHPDALRKALAETFANQQRFQLGHMDDAAECFENILRRIHFHIACSQNEDACNAPHCLPHQKFSMAVYEKVVCPCGASSSPLKFSEMVHYVSASALVAQSRMMQENGDALHPDRFGLLLRKASAVGDVRNCPANCGKRVQKQRTLLNIPDVVSVGLVWDSDHPSVETTTEVAGSLGTAILLQDMYHRVMPDIRKLPRLQLVAIVCYYGKHYSTFVFHSKLKTWIYFDDATVREIGPQWENVVEKCSRGRFQPLLLLYANPSAAPISVDTAPRKRVMAPGYPAVGVPEDSDSGLDRTHESIKSMASSVKRSTTPNSKNPDQQVPPTPGQLQRSVEQEMGRDSPARLTREHTRQLSFLHAISPKPDKNKMGEGGEVGILPGGAPSHPRRQLFDGGANSGHLETMPEDGREFDDYTLSSGDQYRRPSLQGVESNQLPMPPNVARYPDAQRKDSFTRRTPNKEKGVDVVRYPMDPNRAGSHTPDLTHGEGYSPQMGDHMKPPVHHGRQRSLSSSRDEDSADVSSGSQHVVVKPKPTGHGNYDSLDGRSHTPVQLGLATLPRNKGQTHSDNASHYRSMHQEVAQITRKTNAQCRPVDPPLPPGTPPPEYDAVQDPNQPHSRQTSTSSQASTLKGSVSMGCIDQVSKKSDGEKTKKKVKKEKKSEKDPASKKSDKKKSKSDSALKKSESESDLLADKSNKYIDRRMVENILKHQGVHRQNSSCSNNSVSSVESDSLMGKLLASKAANGNLTVDIPYDNMSIGSQKDSGYSGSDRNSASSTGSGTIDPLTQYFLGKSMVIPKSVNTQHLVDQPFPQYSKGPSDPYQGQQTTSHSNGHREDGRKIMHPIKESSQEDMLKLSPNKPIGTQKYIVASVPAPPMEARPPPVPPKNFAQFQIIKSSSQSAHERESSLDSLDKDDNISHYFVSLCKKADALMDSCMLAETQDDVPSALHYCREALSCLKEAQAQKDLNSKALAYVQKKHNSCLLKSRTLQKKGSASRQESHSSGIGSDIASSVGNRSSITSSDSDMSDQVSRSLRLDCKPAPSQHRQHPSQDSTSSRVMHERQNSGSSRQTVEHPRSMEGRMGAYPQQRMANPMQQDAGGIHHRRTDSNGPSHMSHSQSATFAQGSGSSSGADSGGSNADLYGTLPRDKSRKPTSDAPTSPEVYQSFLNKQKCLQASVTASQQSLDSVKSDSGSDHSSGGQKMTRSEIRQLLQEKFVQRQQTSQQQSGPAQPYPRQDMRQPSMPQRPGQNYGQNVPPSQPGHFPRPQQQQQYPQYPQHPQQQYHPTQQQQQQNYHQQQYPQHYQQQQPPAGYPTPTPTHAAQRAPSQSAPPISSQKPSIPYPSAAAKASRPPANQGPAFPPQQNSSESTNERVHTPEGSIDSQRSVSANDGASSDAEGAAVSVRALASRFESPDTIMGRAGSPGSRPCSRPGSFKSEGKDRTQGPSTVQRTRSKSESFSRKPKSVLKNKKNKSRPRKSVTFADSIADYANCDDANSGYESAKEISSPRMMMDDRAYYSDDEERLGSHVSYSDNDLDDAEDTGSSNSDDSPVAEEDACQLCNKRRKDPGKLFCGKCSFYMGRLKSS